MGLDMYLHAEKWISGYEYPGNEENAAAFKKLIELAEVEAFVDPETPSGAIEVTVAYWRKANQIHKWFVDECQGGVDECQETPVSREKLAELVKLCKAVLAGTILVETGKTQEVHVLGQDGALTVEERPVKALANPAVAEERLPTQAGFFFGATEYDESYRYDVESTVIQLERALQAPPEWQFSYRSSW